MKKEFEIGRVVESLAGRDAGRRYVVWDNPGTGYVLVTDGKYHPSGKPKKKNMKHLATKGLICDTIKENLLTAGVLDAQIRQFLKCSDDFHKEEG